MRVAPLALAAACVLAFGPACGTRTTELRVFPLPAERGSVIIAVEVQSKLGLTGYDLDPQHTAIHLPDLDALHSGTVITALVFDASLADLYLKPGDIPPLDPTDPTSQRLMPNHVYRFDPDAMLPANAWVTTILSTRLADIHVPGPPDTCATFDTQGLAPAGVIGLFAAAIDDESAVVATDAGLFTLNKDGAMTPLVSTPPLSGVASGVRDETGELWFCAGPPSGSNAASGVFHGHRAPDGTFPLTLAATSTFACGRYLAAASTDQGPEIFYLHLEGDLERIDASSSRALFVFPTPPGGETKGAIARLGPGRIAAARASTEYVLLDENGRQSMTSPSSGDVSSLRQHPDLGLLAGTLGGDVSAYKDGVWNKLVQRSAANMEIYAIAPYENGFMYGGSGGAIGQYKSAPCPQLVRSGFQAVLQLVPLGRDVLVVYDHVVGGSDVPFALLRRN